VLDVDFSVGPSGARCSFFGRRRRFIYLFLASEVTCSFSDQMRNYFGTKCSFFSPA
jgi:hypothetical protein